LPPRRLPRHSTLQTKHVKPAQQGEQGQILKKEFPVHHSNVAVYSTTQQVTSRVGIK
jgi:large subunit ribosomal protein L24